MNNGCCIVNKHSHHQRSLFEYVTLHQRARGAKADSNAEVKIDAGKQRRNFRKDASRSDNTKQAHNLDVMRCTLHIVCGIMYMHVGHGKYTVQQLTYKIRAWILNN